ncbi:response regulator [Fulvivirga lutimaris]|uniref:response regulator n=1 Tax=Fulvivirga lutimaris TaxID=1819566 RepID=UPI0012BD41D1|nr:response regulator [Fulvivirga lutimaris]MTI41318.1 response regulator [Fulvivirga lutimaris]
MSKKIFVIDDSRSIRELIALFLEESGYRVDKAVDGVDGLKLFDGRPVDAVITDLNMPEMDGISLVREVRKIEMYQYVPIIVLTTDSQTSLKEEAKAAGATGWFTKPFTKEKLLDLTNKLTR